MERPEIKDKKVLAYVENLERQLNNLQAGTTIAKSYVAAKKFVDGVNQVIYAVQLDIRSITNKDDKVIDRASKFMDNILEYNEKLKKLESLVNPKLIEDAEYEMIDSPGLLEEVLRKQNGV